MGEQAKLPFDAENDGADPYHLGASDATKGEQQEEKPKEKPTDIIGWLVLTGDDGKPMDGHSFLIERKDEDFMLACGEEFPPDDKGRIHMPYECAKGALSYSSPSFNQCTYTATRDYLSSRWGRVLHDSDLDWMKYHPFATDQGVSAAFLPDVLQQLLDPYGMGISAIRLRQGFTILPDTPLRRWMDALGTNPFALTDHRTPNEEAVKKLPGLSLAEADKMWRFEFADEPWAPSILGERNVSTVSAGTSVGSSGGHAKYLPPRGRYWDWEISIMLRPLESLEYFAPLELPEYKMRKGVVTLQRTQLKDRDGKYLVTWRGGKLVRNTGRSESASSVYGLGAGTGSHVGKSFPKGSTGTGSTTSPTTTTPATDRSQKGGGGVSWAGTTKRLPAPGAPLTPSKPEQKADEFSCALCAKTKKWEHRMSGTEDVCRLCYYTAWEPYKCPECGLLFGGTTAPTIRYRDLSRRETVFECPKKKCRQPFLVKDVAHEGLHPRLVQIGKLVTR